MLFCAKLNSYQMDGTADFYHDFDGGPMEKVVQFYQPLKYNHIFLVHAVLTFLDFVVSLLPTFLLFILAYFCFMGKPCESIS